MRPSQRKAIFAAVPGRPDLKRFVGFEGDNGGVLGALNTGHPRPLKPPYVYKRRDKRPPAHHLGALGVADRHVTFPSVLGTPGSLFQGDYSEDTIWGTDNSTDGVTAPVDPGTPVDETPGPQEMDPGISIPFGISLIAWSNPTTMQSVPINASTSITLPVLSLNMQRNSLIIQNNSTATSPDIAPNFYVGFNAQPQVGLSLTLQPGAGILFDILTPRDSIYITVAGGSGVSALTQGVIVQGTYAPI